MRSQKIKNKQLESFIDEKQKKFDLNFKSGVGLEFCSVYALSDGRRYGKKVGAKKNVINLKVTKTQFTHPSNQI